MLIRFSVENFLSFKERQTFSMIPSAKRIKKHHKTKPVKGVSALKTSVIYGANASGKSNLVKALKFGRDLILKTQNNPNSIVYEKFKLCDECHSLNTRMQYEIQHQGKNYAYGFVFNHLEIVEEWLYELTQKGEKVIFTRDKNREKEEFALDALYKLNKDKEEQDFLKFIAKGTLHNKLFLSEINSRNVSENVTNINDIISVLDWFRNALKIIFPDDKYNEGLKFEIIKDENLLDSFKAFLTYFDTGISSVALEDVEAETIKIPEKLKQKIKEDLSDTKSENMQVMLSSPNISYVIFNKGDEIQYQKFITKHHHVNGKKEVPFDTLEESDGTNRMMDFIPVILDLLKGDNVFIIDEMERSLHPNIIYDLVDLFLEQSADKNSQLILASHESSLLTQDLLRLDEIWFAHKNKIGATELSSLEDYSIRFDKQIRKDYLLGRYKAVPSLGDRSKLKL